MNKIYYILVLHAHLPYIVHEDNYIEENWFFENMVESYIPFIRMIENLIKDDIIPRITLSLSPTLISMMESKKMISKLSRYVDLRLELIENEYKTDDSRIKKILDIYKKLYEDAKNFINSYGNNLIRPFKALQDNNIIEIITTPATYPILPLLVNKESLDAQITIATNYYRDKFNRNLNGIFLSECAYDERIETYLIKNNINYFFLDDRAIDIYKYSPYTNYITEQNLSVFIRDWDSYNDIFNPENGYVAKGVYREFYRDIGYDKDTEYLKKYTLTDKKIPTGLKFYRITGMDIPLDKKELYDFDLAQNEILSDVKDFLYKRINQIKGLDLKQNPVITNCFSMELFGHRWFEGMIFIENLFRTVRQDRLPLQFITPSEYLNINKSTVKIKPQISSWDKNGYFDIWVNEKNDFIYPYIYEITTKYIQIINKYTNRSNSYDIDRALKQLTREVLMLQASDWPTLIYNDTYRDYALNRIKKHYENAIYLINSITENNIKSEILEKLEKETDIFPLIDFKHFTKKSVI